MATATKEPTTLDTPEAEHEETPDTGGALFDRSQFDREDLQIPKVDGQGIDRIRLGFTGSVFLDRSDPGDVALYNRLRFQGPVTLMVEGKCSSVGAKGATDREGDLDVVIGQKHIKIETVYLSTADGLAAHGVAGEDELDGGTALDEAA